MIKFVKRKDELDVPLDQWLYALKHAPELEEQPSFLKAPEIDHFFDLARYANFTEGERTMYRTAQQVRWDNQNALDFAKDKAEEKGHKLGLEKGLEQGREQGREQGIEQGIELGLEQGREEERVKAENEKREMAVKLALEMLKDDEPLEKISRYTQLSVEEIEAIA